MPCRVLRRLIPRRPPRAADPAGPGKAAKFITDETTGIRVRDLHKNARTTPAIRRELRASKRSERALARQYNLTHTTVYKWRHRKEFTDRSHRPHTHQPLPPQWSSW